MGIGCRIVREIDRAPAQVVEMFREIPVSNLDDCMGRMAAVHQAIRPLNRSRLLGTAFTIRVPAGDNLMFHRAMDLAQPGDVIMIDAGGGENRAIFGSLMANYCKARGIAGIVVDGSVRDAAELEKLEDFAVYARGISPNGPYKNGPGEINVPICVGGIFVHPGDIVVGDFDGIVVIRPQEAEEIAKAARAVMEKEDKLLRGILQGVYDRPCVEEKLREIGCEYV